jgi:dienelactone hydrolase
MKRIPVLEQCEDRTLFTLVYLLNGTNFTADGPSELTDYSGTLVRQAGNRVVQLSTPTVNTPAAYQSLAATVVKMAHGRTIGLVGVGAGGSLALRIATSPGLKVSAVLDYFGVPDAQAYLDGHGSRQPVVGLAPYRSSVVSLLSGPLTTQAHVVAAFGRNDPNVQPATSTADLLRDDPSADVYTYPGGYGAPINASKPALEDFLSHLG